MQKKIKSGLPYFNRIFIIFVEWLGVRNMHSDALMVLVWTETLFATEEELALTDPTNMRRSVIKRIRYQQKPPLIHPQDLGKQKQVFL